MYKVTSQVYNVTHRRCWLYTLSMRQCKNDFSTKIMLTNLQIYMFYSKVIIIKKTEIYLQRCIHDWRSKVRFIYQVMYEDKIQSKRVSSFVRVLYNVFIYKGLRVYIHYAWIIFLKRTQAQYINKEKKNKKKQTKQIQIETVTWGLRGG